MKLNGTILFYRPEQGMLPEIPVLCALKKIRCRSVGPEQADFLIGELAGLLKPAAPAAETEEPGTAEKNAAENASAETEKPAPAAMTQPMLVFCSLPNRVLDGFLADMKARKIRVPIKAVLTEHNVSWTLRALYGELRGEHAALTGEKL